jgi:hypothetical protein
MRALMRAWADTVTTVALLESPQEAAQLLQFLPASSELVFCTRYSEYRILNILKNANAASIWSKDPRHNSGFGCAFSTSTPLLSSIFLL